MSYGYVGSAHSASSSTVSYAPTAGNLIVIDVSDFLGTGTPVAALTDNLGTTYAVAMPTTQGGSSGYQLSTFFLLNCPAGITTLTVSFSGGAVSGGVPVEILVREYSGLRSYLGAAALEYVTLPGTGANAITSNAVNVTTQPGILVGSIFNPSQNTCSAGTSPLAFTARYAVGGSGMFGEDVRVTATGNTQATATTSNGSNSFLVAAMAFAESAVSFGIGQNNVVQSAFASSNNSGSVTFSPGSTLVVGAYGGKSAPVITDGVNTWSQRLTQTFNGGLGFASLNVVQGIAGGALTLTATQSSGDGLQFWYVEILAAKTSGGLDGAVASEPAGTGTVVTGPSVNTATPGAIVLAFLAGAGNGGAAPNLAGFGTLLDPINGAYIPGCVTWQNAPTIGSYYDGVQFPGQTAYDFAAFTVSVAPASAAVSQAIPYPPLNKGGMNVQVCQ